jgi:hypothetical protein
METVNDTQLRAYWLGGIPAPERERLEEICCGDEELFERLRLAESELLDEYANNALPRAERARFEEFYLAQPGRRERLARTQAFHRQIAAPTTAPAAAGWFDWLRGPLWPRVAFAALLLACLAGGWWLWRNRPGPHQVVVVTPTPAPPVSSPTPAPAPSPKVETTPRETVAPTPPPATPQPTPPPRPVASPAPVTLAWAAPALLGGSVRDGNGATADLAPPPGTRHVRLRVRLAERKQFYLVVEDAAGQRVTEGPAQLENSGGEPLAAIVVPARRLPVNDYRVKLYARRPAPGAEPERTYRFRIVPAAGATPPP